MNPQDLKMILKHEVAQLRENTKVNEEMRQEAIIAYDQLLAQHMNNFGTTLSEVIIRSSLMEELEQNLRRFEQAKKRIHRGDSIGANAINEEYEPVFVPEEEGHAIKTWRKATGHEQLNNPEAMLADFLNSRSAAPLREIIALSQVGQQSFDDMLAQGFLNVDTKLGKIQIPFGLGTWPNKTEKSECPDYSAIRLPLGLIHGDNQLASKLQAQGYVVEKAEGIEKLPGRKIVSFVRMPGGDEDDTRNIYVYHFMLMAAKKRGHDLIGNIMRKVQNPETKRRTIIHSYVQISKEMLEAWEPK